MIHEFALEPELVAGLTERSAARYFAESFGLGQPRLVSRFPKRWKKLAWEAFQQTHPDCSEGQRKIVEELIQRLSEKMVRRGDLSWEPSRSWLENAEQEHDRRPFRGIVARANPRSRAEVLIDRDLGEQSSSRWVVVRGAAVERKAGPMASLVLPLLRCCGEVIFIDPHFGPEKPSHRRPLEAFLEALVDGRMDAGTLKVEVHAKVKSTTDFFRDQCQDQLGRCIPVGLSVKFRRWMERAGGETLHNRYILTDLGGLIFSHGLDEGSTGETDDVSLMDRDQYILRWNQYVSDSPAFDSTEVPVDVMGTKRLHERR